MGGHGEAEAEACGQIHQEPGSTSSGPSPDPSPNPTTLGHARPHAPPRQAAWAKNVPFDEEALCLQQQQELLAAGTATRGLEPSPLNLHPNHYP